ncbi:MAG: molybdate ABC transporter permease subunit [Magnetococcales bacterium]|nr:molybdate ABC transporter permease subunit [Magnetococcales bacterium]
MPSLLPQDLGTLTLTLTLASITTLLLLVIGTPLAWWLAFTRSRIRVVVESLVALPLVLPPTVLGFYLLVIFAPSTPVGSFWRDLFGEPLPFSFTGLVVASMLYSLPFVIQPLQRAFEEVGHKPLEAAWTLGASPLRAFFDVALPMAARGYVTAAVLSFAHTLGEFGVVLMVGGNIPGRTQVLSIVIYDHVESLAYDQAHLLSAILLGFSFLALLIVYSWGRRPVERAS